MLRKLLFPLVFALVIVAAAAFFIEYFFSSPPSIAEEVSVVIPEGKSVSEIEAILKEAEVLREGDSLFDNHTSLEGYLFPDTYRFFKHSTVPVIVSRFFENFKSKAEPILRQDTKNFQANLILASIIEREVPEFSDRKIVAGILKKRLAVGMPLQVDATLCYLKLHAVTDVDLGYSECYPITKRDKEIDSQYNTYLYAGLPPGPISNPGESALLAVLESEPSAYWYYLSDPDTKKTIFSRTLDEHAFNIAVYLD